jgi:hypothetical protein
MRNLITILLIVVCCALCRAQDPNTTIEQNSTLPVQTTETLPWSETTTTEFQYNGEGYLIDHLRNHPMLGDELDKLHEWLHQRIERLRPRDANGLAYSTVFFEGTDAQFNAWAERQAIEAAGWKVVRLPASSRLVNVVAIGKTHFSHAGHLTIDALRRFVNQVENRKFKPVKNARARFVTRITKYTRDNCPACREWERDEEPKAKAAGVEVLPVTDAVNSVPWFEVQDSFGTVTRYYGKTSFEAMKRGVQ